MAGRSISPKDILVPLGTLVAAVSMAVGIVHWSDTADAATKTQLATNAGAITALDAGAAKLEARADKADERWNIVVQHLAAIEQALKIKPETIAQH